MRKNLLATTLLLLVLCASSALGQSVIGAIGRGANTPASCNFSQGQMFVNTGGSAGLYLCGSTGVYAAVGSGGGGGGGTGGGGTVTVTGNSLTSGGGIAWSTGYSYIVSAASYSIQGTAYTSPQTTVTLAAAHATLDRIDVIAVNTSSAVEVITGTASANPAIPAYNPDTQLPLGFVYVNHNTTAPPNVANTNVYLENTEWTCTGSGTVNCADTTSPYAGSKDIKVTSAATSDFVNLANGSPININTANNLVFFIKNISVNSKRNLQLTWSLSGTVVGSPVVVSNGVFGYSNTNTSAYQQIVIPISAFALNNSNIDSLKITTGGSGGTPSFYLDNILVQSGQNNNGTQSTGIAWKGTWSASTSYSVNDAVIYNFLPYVCIVSNVNNAPYGSADWQALGGFPVHQFSFGVPGTLASGQEVGLGTVAFAVTFPANFAGSYAFIGPNGANPTSTNTITIKKNSGGVLTTIGTLSTNTSGVTTFATTGGLAQSLGAGDGLIAINQNPADATFASFAFTLVGYLGAIGPNVSFTGTGAAVTGPNPSVVDNIATWGNTTGGTLKDSGVAVGTVANFGSTWAAWTPTITAQTGTYTSTSTVSRYMQIGKTVYFTIYLTVTTTGTASAATLATLPVAPKTNAVFAGGGRENQVTGKSFYWIIDQAGLGSVVKFAQYDNAFGISDGSKVAISGFYETN